MRVLLIEDDTKYRERFTASLRKFYLVDVVTTVTNADTYALDFEYDAILLDQKAFSKNDKNLCNNIRKAQPNVPIIVITESPSYPSNLKYRLVGADACIPPDINDVVLDKLVHSLRIRSAQNIVSDTYLIGKLAIDVWTKQVSVNGKNIALRRKEYDLLELMALNECKTVSRETILEHLWERGLWTTSNTIEVHMSRLREKIEKPFGYKFIKTIKGFGYKLCPEDENV